jgi:mannose-6-phosphate isomerase-like protein (cupin superfamily)
VNFSAINFSEKLAQFNEYWAPRTVASLNDYHFKLAKIQGEFVWHSHPETDEAFIVLHGRLRILLRDGEVLLQIGELYVVPRGVEHKPVAEAECHILLLEPAGTLNTGDAADSRLAAPEIWI